MNNKVVGSIFCLISALLMSARYLTAGIFMSGMNSWGSDLFSQGLEYIGSPLKIASIIALIVGIIFLLYGVYQDLKKSQSEK